MLRLYSALFLAFLAVFAIWRGSYWFDIFWVSAAAAILWEWGALVSDRLRWSRFLPGLAMLFGLCLWQKGYCLGQVSPYVSLLILVMCLISICFGLALGEKRYLWNFLGLAYAGILLYTVKFLYYCTLFDGTCLLLWLFAIVWLTDIGAYIGGHLIGGAKLWPQLSPSKTWAGFFTGLIAGTLSGSLAFWCLCLYKLVPHVDIGLPLWGLSVVLAFFLALATQLGDLLESGIKRYFGVKDSGKLIPGHGGVMDRLDGFWLASLLLASIVSIYTRLI